VLGRLAGASVAARRPVLADSVVRTMPHGMLLGTAGFGLILFSL